MDIVEQLREIAKQDENYIPVGESINTLAADEIEQLRAFKAACEGQVAVAYVVKDDEGEQLMYPAAIFKYRMASEDDIIADLFPHPDTEVAQLRMRIADLERKLANERASAIHTCGPDCPRSGCVERHERDQQVAEACAKVCDIAEEDYANREYHRYPELRTDAETGIGEVGYAILSGEWKKYMKGGE